MKDHLPSEARIAGVFDSLAGKKFDPQNPPYQENELNRSYLLGMEKGYESRRVAEVSGVSLGDLTVTTTELAIPSIESTLSDWACGFTGMSESSLEAHREDFKRRWRIRH